MELRTLVEDDVDGCAAVFHASLHQLSLDLGLSDSTDDGPSPVDRARISHLTRTDPGLGWVMVDGHEPIGFAQAFVRGDRWVLAHLFVHPHRQNQQIGSRLLAAAMTSCDTATAVIGSTPDPRAITAYARAGFELHPTLTGTGVVRDRLPISGSIRDGHVDDLPGLAAFDLESLGCDRTVDLSHLLETGHRLRIAASGYSLLSDHAVLMVSATDTTAGHALLADALNQLRGNGEIRIPRVTSQQPWAIQAAAAAGLRIRPWGPLCTRGVPTTPPTSLPHPALC